MAIVVLPNYKDEPFDKMFRRFKNKVRQADLMEDIKKFEHYEKPSIRKRNRKRANKLK